MVSYIMTKKESFWLHLIVFGFFWLIFLALVARFWRFGQVPQSLYWDEVAIGLDARSLAQTGKDLSAHPWLQPLFYSYGDYKAPIYIWLTALLAKLFTINQVTVRLPSFLAGLGSAWLLFKLVKLLSPPRSFLPLYVLTSFLVMPWTIHFSRIGMESHLSLFWLVLSSYLVVSAVKKRQDFRIILGGLAACLGIYSYISLRLIAPLIFIASFLLFRRRSSQKSLASFLIGLFLIGFSLFILMRSPGYSASQQYRLSNDNLITSTKYIEESASAIISHQGSLAARIVHHRYLYKIREYLSNYFSHFDPHFLFLSGDPNLRHHSGFGGQLLLVQAVFLLLGFWALANYPRRQTWFILIWLLLSPVIASLVNEVPHASRAISLVVPLAWLCGLGLDWLVTRVQQGFRSAAILIIIIALSLNLGLYLHDYFRHYPQRSQLAWLLPYKQAALYLKEKTDQPVYITDQWYQPALYFAFYQNIPSAQLQASAGQYLDQINNFIFQLPAAGCPADAWCLAEPAWQADKTKTIATIPGIDQLVIKTSFNEN
jgi:4-amino-4-deoxy-L-arabinose transferase-like glycosyltransferase